MESLRRYRLAIDLNRQLMFAGVKLISGGLSVKFMFFANRPRFPFFHRQLGSLEHLA